MATEGLGDTSAVRITSRAPARIDLAGGTVDIWPLYLFLKDPLTINLGIDLFAEAHFECRPGKGEIRLRSEDQNTEILLAASQLTAENESLKIPPGLILHYKLLYFFARKFNSKNPKDLSKLNVLLSTKAKSPAGAGLGGSSTLSIAIIGALASWIQGRPVDPAKEGEKFIEITRDVETTVIQVPAGLQDYYGAMFGGLQSIRWLPGSHDRSFMPQDTLKKLESRLLLFYSGQSRNSGINNWALFKGLIDREGGVQEKFEEIASATRDLQKALSLQDWEGASRAIQAEWATRRTLAPGISTPVIDRGLELAGGITPVSGKVCGAGGGGCFFVFVPSGSDEAKTKIQEIFACENIRALPFRAVTHGLEVTVSGA